ncbi:MAG TPA: serine/threonine-protein kinase, partial [Candidatus Polarisedimenticolaceae bacterium]|nr:serine/threonine-protein kinase [Candidatus Polarisedimenticolaceae bacterium]
MDWTPERFAELDRLFQQALELEPAAREAFVARQQQRSPETGRRLREMLRADGRTGASIDEIVAAVADAFPPERDRLVGERFGPYRAERLLGRGGMGAVYLGERIEGDFAQTAAIKTVRFGLESPQLLDRFRREREILAQLDHPGIARLLDGGPGPHGLPFVAMEYVDGLPITEYVRREKCGLVRRLELFAELCDAVAFVHRNSIVHRDIKAGNVLVTREGRVKLLDFGIAKLDDAFDLAGLTRTEQRPMTPEYASPEQVLNQPITTASDIYSLGVLLYELLTDVRPVRLTSREPYAMAKAIVDQIPALPSQAASPLPPWQRRLRGDLDRIVMTALRKEPERRYASVTALADDVRRYLAGRPVSATADVWHYRLRKWLGRHPVAGAVAVIFLVTVG